MSNIDSWSVKTKHDHRLSGGSAVSGLLLVKERVKDHICLPVEVGIVVEERADNVRRRYSTGIAEKKLADPREHQTDVEPSEITEL
jgi:hypothetical protein